MSHVAELIEGRFLQDKDDLQLARFPQVLIDVLLGRSSGMTIWDIFALPQSCSDRSSQLLDKWWLEALAVY